jgi:hypothetical protein
MVTLFVIGYLIYFFAGAMLSAHFLYKYLDDYKTPIAVWHLLAIIVTALLPFTLMIDFGDVK